MGIDYETSLETKLELQELLREGQTSTCDMKKKGGGLLRGRKHKERQEAGLEKKQQK